MADTGTDAESVNIEIVFALPGDTTVIPITVRNGCTVEDAIKASGITKIAPDIIIDKDNVGIFNNTVSLGDTVNEGDRVEIYRPLIADPKETRRKRAAGKKS